MLKTSQQKYLLCPTRQGLPPCVHVSGTGTSMCILKSRGALPSPYPKAHNAEHLRIWPIRIRSPQRGASKSETTLKVH